MVDENNDGGDYWTPDEVRRASLLMDLRNRYGVPMTPDATVALAIEAEFILKGSVIPQVQMATDIETLVGGEPIDLTSMDRWPAGIVGKFAQDDIHVVSMSDGSWIMLVKDDDGEWALSSVPGWNLQDLIQVAQTWGGLLYAGWYTEFGLDGAHFEGQ